MKEIEVEVRRPSLREGFADMVSRQAAAMIDAFCRENPGVQPVLRTEFDGENVMTITVRAE